MVVATVKDVVISQMIYLLKVFFKNVIRYLKLLKPFFHGSLALTINQNLNQQTLNFIKYLEIVLSSLQEKDFSAKT